VIRLSQWFITLCLWLLYDYWSKMCSYIVCVILKTPFWLFGFICMTGVVHNQYSYNLMRNVQTFILFLNTNYNRLHELVQNNEHKRINRCGVYICKQGRKSSVAIISVSIEPPYIYFPCPKPRQSKDRVRGLG
jgi:hypothetical protein